MKKSMEEVVKIALIILTVDSRFEIEQESDVLIADYSFDECSFFKDDDNMCA